jgi:hypothetical protein
VQAIGIMASMWNESGFDPEAKQQGVSDPGYGLIQWEASSYPSAPSLVTGNAVADMQAQITFLAQTGGFAAASGTTYQETAANFATRYERCGECQPGESQYNSRVANAATIAGWIVSGKWPATAPSPGSGSSKGAPNSTADCVWGNVPGFAGWPGFCLITNGELRALIGLGLLLGGLPIAFVALRMMMTGDGLAQTTAKLAGGGMEAAGAATMAVPGGEAAGAAIAGAGSKVRKQGKARPTGAGRSAATRRKGIQADEAELRAKGASDIRTAQKPRGTLGPPTKPSRAETGRAGTRRGLGGVADRRAESARARSARYAGTSAGTSGNSADKPPF